MTSLTFSAVLLAAGRSSRMGSDKALLVARDGQPLWRRQRDVLVRAGATEIFISAREEQRWAAGEAVVRDAALDGGPLAGIVAALTRMDATPARVRAGEVAEGCTHLAVLAVDLPQMETAWFSTLLAEAAPGLGVVGKLGDFFEPLAALYPREILPLAPAALAKRELSLQRLLAVAVACGLMRGREISDAEAAWFENWNEPRTP